jgi:hypothetical protein
MLTRGDDYPIHQTPEPIAYAGTDRNFYDRYSSTAIGRTEGTRPSSLRRSGSIPR